MKKMKRILLIALSILTIAACAIGLPSCDLLGLLPSSENQTSSTSNTGSSGGSENTSHEHSYEATLTAPTCTKRGYISYTCFCGDNYIDTYINKSEHIFINGVCKDCNGKPSEILVYELREDGQSYEVSHINTGDWNLIFTKDLNVIIPSTYNGKPVTAIGRSAFSSCYELTNVDLPDSVTSIEPHAFYKCENLKDVRIGNNTVSLGNVAFADCEYLTSVIIPDSVASIDPYTFSGCTSLANIIVNENNATYKSIEGHLYTKDGNTLIQYAIGNTKTSFIIPDTVTSIGEGAFQTCSYLTSVTMGSKVNSIGMNAFGSCRNLKNITISDSVTSIDYYAFASCKSLTNITIPDSVTSINSYAFAYCDNLSTVILPDSITEISRYTFYKCTSLTSLEIPDSVTTIGTYALAECSSLASVVIDDSVIEIIHHAFYNYKRLTSVYYKGTAEEWANIAIGSLNDALTNATRYYYSETHPTEEGNYWHYDENGEVVVW